MEITFLVSSVFGSKTRIALDYALQSLENKNAGHRITLIDLKDYNLQFSDGRNYLDYTGDTGFVVQQLMNSDAIIIGTPIFQASIPGTLKNIFDLLPVNAFRDKVVGIVAVAGSAKHYMIVEQQLKPILSYMKAQIVQTYVFAEDIDFLNGKIINDDIFFRIDHLVEETVTLMEIYQKVKEEKDAEYNF